MKIATNVNGGDCSECEARQSLTIQVVVKEDAMWGYVSCDECGVWITDLMPDELLSYGIEVDKKYL